MRCMTLAIALTALGWIAAVTEVRGNETTAIDISPTHSTRNTYLASAADRLVAEVTSPSDVAAPSTPAQPMSQPMSGNVIQEGAVTHDMSMVHGYRPPLPFGPSAPSTLLQFLTCDPHSCPNIWQGYEAQRAAELARKCTPPGGCSHGGCGIGGGSNLYGSPCIDCASRPRKIVNRYRPAPAAPCSTCGNAGCDSLGSESGSGSCSSCQAATKAVDNGRLSEAPTPATTR